MQQSNDFALQLAPVIVQLYGLKQHKLREADLCGRVPPFQWRAKLRWDAGMFTLLLFIAFMTPFEVRLRLHANPFAA